MFFELGCGRAYYDVMEFSVLVLGFILFFALVWFLDSVDHFLHFLERFEMEVFLAREALFELELGLGHVDFGGEVLARDVGAEFLEPSIGAETVGLHFVFIGLFVEREPVARDRRVHGGSEIPVVFDYISALGFVLDGLAGLEHFAEDLDAFALDLGNRAFFVFGLFEPDFIHAFCVLFFGFFLALDQCALQQV